MSELVPRICGSREVNIFVNKQSAADEEVNPKIGGNFLWEVCLKLVLRLNIFEINLRRLDSAWFS